MSLFSYWDQDSIYHVDYCMAYTLPIAIFLELHRALKDSQERILARIKTVMLHQETAKPIYH